MKLPVHYRDAVATDLPFIMNSWLRSWRDSDFAKLMKNEVFYENYEPFIKGILQRANVLVACSVDDPDQIFGYIVYENPQIVHYVYVKTVYKKLGLAKSLFKRTVDITKPIVVTHANDYYEAVKGKYTNLIYNPFINSRKSA
jgi:hypothetical protein